MLVSRLLDGPSIRAGSRFRILKEAAEGSVALRTQLLGEPQRRSWSLKDREP